MKFPVFRIINKCFQNANYFNPDGAHFFLEENDWNDYSYYTQYHLHATKHLTGRGTEYLGPISIMKIGQKEGEYPLKSAVGNDVLTALPENFCSLSFSVDLFVGLAKYLKPKERVIFAKAMHLIIDRESPYYEKVKTDNCFLRSLLRGGSIDSFALKKSKTLLYNTARLYDLLKQELSFKLSGQDDIIQMKFSPSFEPVPVNYPIGVFAFIGKNGSGKSTVLYRLAKILFADPKARDILSESTGTLTPNDIGIYKLLLISYSAFDNFVLPGMNKEDYRLILDRINKNDGRFVFCGLRDIHTDYERLLEREDNTDYNCDRISANVQLKPQQKLGEEFATAYYVVRSRQEWREMIDEAKEYEGQIAELHDQLLIHENISLFYDSLSTGYKFFFHAITHVMAYIENDSMVLLDEPENYLHPPLLSFMIRQMRKIMKSRHSIMMIATHSPIVLQEVMSENVRIISRCGNVISIRKPQIETYGENLGVIISEVFNLTSDNTRYYNVFDSLYNQWECDDMKCSEDVLNTFSENLNTQISTQMAQYLIGKWFTNKKVRECGN